MLVRWLEWSYNTHPSVLMQFASSAPVSFVHFAIVDGFLRVKEKHCSLVWLYITLMTISDSFYICEQRKTP
jgi:hypothetical protein